MQEKCGEKVGQGKSWVARSQNALEAESESEELTFTLKKKRTGEKEAF